MVAGKHRAGRRNVRALVLWLLLCACSAREAAAPPPTAEDVHSLPLRVEVGVDGRFFPGRAWTMHVEPDGRAAVFLRSGSRVDGGGGLPAEVHTLELSFDELEGLRRCLVEERYFELPPVLGRPADDLGPTWIEVRLGPHSHRVERLLTDPREMAAGSNGVRGTPAEVERAGRVFERLAGHLGADLGAARSPAWERALDERGR